MEFQNKLNNNIVQCTVCPRMCKLQDGQAGFCAVRKNKGGSIVLETFGYNTGLAIDPIEKKPLYHFYPASRVLSFGTMGCNMGCLFCQNWHITKLKPDYEKLNYTSPEDIVKTALEHNCKSIAFTYNDPIAFIEYAIETAKIARKAGVKTVAVTSGFMNPEPAKEFFKYMDAANIDLKGFTESFYRKKCLAALAPVLDTIKLAAQSGCLLELTTLLIDGENSSNEEIEQECRWIMENLGADVPLHFSAFFPHYKMQEKASTRIETLMRAYNIAKNIGLNYVYTGNIPDIESSITYCKSCNRPLIVRSGYHVAENNLNGGVCKYCGEKCDGLF